MSVYTYDISKSNSSIKDWVPAKRNDFSELDIIDVSGNPDYSLSLNKDGKLYIVGKVSWMNSEPFYLYPLAGIPPSSKVVEMSTSRVSFAVLTSNGQVYACGSSFSGKLSLLYSGSDAHFIAANKQILVATESTILFYSNQTTHKTIALKDRKIRSVGTFENGFLLLLDDGILYSTENLSQNTIKSQIPELYIVEALLGPQMFFLQTACNEILCIYEDGTMVYGYFVIKGSSIKLLTATLPDFTFENGCICQALLSRDLIWIKTSTNDIYYISKLPNLNPETGHVARFKHAPQSFPSKICHLASNWSEIFFFETGITHLPIAYNLPVKRLQTIVEPFLLHTKNHGSCLVDPLGAVSFGFRPGDRVITPTGSKQIIIGTTNDGKLCIKDDGATIDLIPLPDLPTLLFKWRLYQRHLADFKDFVITDKNGNQCTIQIDCSEYGLCRFCFFKPGDVIEHSTFGIGTVLGERCNSVWIQYEKDNSIRMCSSASSRSLHLEHKLIRRPGKDQILVHEGVDNQLIIIEQTAFGSLEIGSIVSSSVYGIGTYKGKAADQLVIHFISDGPYCRMVPTSLHFTLKRSVSKSTSQPFICLDSSATYINLSLNECKEQFGVVPCDVIKIQNQIAYCVGIGKYEDENSLMFETEIMIKHGIGVGAFCKGKLNIEYEMIARIGIEGKVRKKLADGKEIELSINTDDFQEAKLLPGDELTVNGKQCHVCGIDQTKTLYIEYEDNTLVEPLTVDKDFILYYRRIDVPTKVTADAINSENKQSSFIDIEHFRNSALLPCDVVEDDNQKVAIVGAIDSNHFMISQLNNENPNETGILIVPNGQTATVLSSIFDADDEEQK